MIIEWPLNGFFHDLVTVILTSQMAVSEVEIVVSTVMFGSIFAAFRIVDYVNTVVAFFYDVIIIVKKVPVETESSLETTVQCVRDEDCFLFIFRRKRTFCLDWNFF